MSRSAHRLEIELRALEACADRARMALACAYSSAAEFEAEFVRERQASRFAANAVGRLRVALAATAGAAVVLLVAFSL